MQKRKGKTSVLFVTLCVILLLYTLFMLSMLAWSLTQSVKSAHEFWKSVISFPQTITFEHFSNVMKYNYVRVTAANGSQYDIGLLGQAINTMLFAGVGACVSVVVPFVTAYICAKYKFFYSRVIYAIVLITMVLPIVGAYPSELTILRTLGIYDQIWGNWIQKANPLGMYFLVFFAYSKGLSNTYIEATRIDGASELVILLKIIFPLSIKVLLTVFCIIFVANWNDYQTVLLYLPSHPTLAVGIYKLSRGTISTANLSTTPAYLAGSAILTVPVIILFIIFRNVMMGNISVGGIKE